MVHTYGLLGFDVCRHLRQSKTHASRKQLQVTLVTQSEPACFLSYLSRSKAVSAYQLLIGMLHACMPDISDVQLLIRLYCAAAPVPDASQKLKETPPPLNTVLNIDAAANGTANGTPGPAVIDGLSPVEDERSACISNDICVCVCVCMRERTCVCVIKP